MITSNFNKNNISLNLLNQNSIQGSAKNTLKDMNQAISSSINQFSLNEYQQNTPFNMQYNVPMKSLQEARAIHLNNKNPFNNLAVREIESIKNRLVNYIYNKNIIVYL